MRVATLIIASCAVAALAGAPPAGATGGGTSPRGGGSSRGGGSPRGGGSSRSGGSSPQASPSSGGAGFAPGPVPVVVSTPLHPLVRGFVAKIVDGLAYAPSEAPIQVQRAIWAGDAIRHKPYIYGGGHGTWNDAGYDCSGSVSYVLHAAGLLKTSMDSSEFMSWGQAGIGQWVTVYTNPGHAFVQIAGIRFDTSAAQDPDPPPGTGPRWRPDVTSTAGFVARHPVGL